MYVVIVITVSTGNVVIVTVVCRYVGESAVGVRRQ